MANHKSALKRARQNEKRRIMNKSTRTRVKNVVKVVLANVEEKSHVSSMDKLNAAKSVIDMAAKKGVIHHRTAARKISRLSKLVNTLKS